MPGIFRGKSFQRPMNLQNPEVECAYGHPAGGDVQRISSAPGGIAPAGMIHQDAAHHFRGHAEKLGPALEIETLQTLKVEIEIMNQFRGLENLLAGPPGQNRCRDAPQLAVNCF